MRGKCVFVAVFSAIFSILSATNCFAQDADFAPVNVRLVRATYTKITIKWQAGSSATQAASYKILRNNSEVGTSTEAQYSDTNLQAGTEYIYKIIAVSSAGENSPASAELKVKTIKSVAFDNSDKVEQMVDQLHDTSTSTTALSLITAIKSGLEGLLNTNISYTCIDSDILNDFVAEELAVIQEVAPELTEAERAAAQTELNNLLNDSFGGNTFEHVYIHSKLTELAEKHWAAGHKTAAKALYDFSLKYLSDQETYVFNSLARLARFERDEITGTSTKAEIAAALHAHRDQYNRFFDFFATSTSTQAVYARNMPAVEYFKFFPKLLPYSTYDQNVFTSAQQGAQAALNLAPEDNNEREQKLFEKVDAWELVNQKLIFKDSAGNPVTGTIKVKNITADTDKKYYFYSSEDAFVNEREFTVSTGEAIVPAYKSHIYEMSFSFNVAGGNPIKFTTVGVPTAKGKVATYDNFAEPVLADGTAGDSKTVFVVDHPTSPYNLTSTPAIDVFNLTWDWTDSTSFTATHFKVFRGATEIADVTGKAAVNIPLESPDGISSYTVVAYDAANNASPASRELVVVPGDQTPYADYFAWMQSYFGEQAMYSCDDPDGDGVNCYQEFINGTDPTRIPGPVAYLKQKTYTKITLKWDEFLPAETDISFKIYRNDVEVGTTTENSFTDTGLTPGVVFTYKVKAIRADGSDTEFSADFSLRTMKPETGEYAAQIQQVVDQFNPIDVTQYTGASLVTAVKSGLEALLGTNITFTVVDNDILNNFVEEELTLIKEVAPEMTAAERLTAQTELTDMLNNSFGGNSFEHVYMHSKLTELAEKHWQAGHKTAAKALYECSLGYLNNQETYVFNSLARLGRFELEEITDTSTNAEIITALNKNRDAYLRFFSYFENSTSTQAGYAYRMPATEYFKHFFKLLNYTDYNQDVFNSASQLMQSACTINDDSMYTNARDRINAWELVPLKINIKNADGTPLNGTIQINNVSGTDETVKKVYYNNEEIPEDNRTYNFTGTTLDVPTYKGHLYNITVTVANHDPIVLTNVNYEVGKKTVYSNESDSAVTEPGNAYAEVEFAFGMDMNADYDGDGLTNGEETDVYNTDPFKLDSDDDGYSDKFEIEAGFDPNNPIDATVDTDLDGICDHEEVFNGYNPTVYTKVVYVDVSRPDDTEDGLSLASAKKTISAAVNISKDSNYENVILVAAGTYTGASNRDISFGGFDIKLKSIDGAATTIIDLENASRFLVANSGESLNSLIDGFTIKNGWGDNGGAICLWQSSLTIKNCIFNNNSTSAHGGAVWVNKGQSNIENCNFTNNYSTWGSAVGYYENGSSTVKNCSFVGNKVDNCGALAFDCWTSGVTLNIEKCKFVNNYASGNIASLYLKCYQITANINNCLFFDNFASWCPDIRTESGPSTLNIRNVTVAKSKYTNNILCYFSSNTTVTIENSILHGEYSASSSFTANNNCTQQDISSYGTGNITAIAELTGTGQLKSGSPLIDAGKLSDAPADDIDGITRPAGSGVDIGCYEFTDSDNDGMDDAWETVNFGDLNKTAIGDEDNDQLNNLAEYNYGTNPNVSDTDGDGFSDKTEIDTGYNPLLPLKTIYVDNARPDDNGDGLTLATAKKTIWAAVSVAKQVEYENEILLAAGTYAGSSNRRVYSSGCPVRIRSSAGAANTVIDLEQSAYFFNTYAPAIIDGLTIKNSSESDVEGCSIFAEDSEILFRNCVFKDNSTEGWGGAMYFYSCKILLENCVFDGNLAYGGGAVAIQNSYKATIKSCEFNDNATTYGKAPAILIDTSSIDVKIEKCKFTNNLGSGECGAFYMISHGGPTTLNATNCLFMGNIDSNGRGDIYIDGDANANITNVTVVKADTSTAACCFGSGVTVELQNNIIHGWIDRWGALTANNNAYQASLDSYGSNNIVTTNPMVDARGNLLENSPCIDTGLATGAPVQDLAGISRPQGTGIDIGCYEYADSDNDGIADNTELELGYDPAVYTKVVYVDASKADDTGDGLSLATAKQTIKAAVDMSRDTGFENVIMVAAGTYTGVNNKNIDFSGYDIKLRSISGAATTIIDLENSGRFLYLHTGETKASWLDGFTVKNGNVSDGGGVRFENAAMTLKNSVFMNNYASNYSYGGAIRSDNGSLLIVNCQFTNNHSYHHGGAIYQKYGKTSLENCSFIGNIGRRGGALALYEGVTLTADSCVFLRNLCNEEGGVVSSDNNCTSTFTNCLAMDNRARGNYTFALCYDNETMNLVNSTVVQGPSNMAGMRITGTLNVTNSVFRVTFAGTPASVVNSITTSDCSAYGANNVVADPQLNSMGYPWLNSPCIDAGTATGAPAKDMDGVSRPAGAGVDIGCYEFLDSDSDGIPDNIEIAAGLNPNDGSDANGDIDNDGISNLKEYTTGTSSSSSDSDNDGIADNTELELGYDPAVYTKVVYVDASKADDTGDGLSLATAKQTIKAAVDMSRDTGFENVIMVAAGTYTGVNNKNIDFSGYDIKLRSISGAATTIIDLENSGRFLYLHTGETKASWLDGFTVKNGNVSDGGGVRFENAAMTLKNSVFMNNYASNYSYGGAIRSDNGSLLIVNCQFTNNHSYHHGGAIYQKYGKTSLENCSFIGNIGRRGGALALYEGVTLTADSCVFLRNLCNEEGGVVSSDNNCTSTFTNCLAMDNRARGNYTFALCYDNETMNLVNSTVVQGPSNMAGMRITGTLNVTNSVFRVTFAGTPASVVNSITTSDCSAYGANNVVADPQLNSMGYPWLNSPCIDAGTATGAPAKDMDGVSRPAGAGVDIGCYEFLDSDSDGIPDNIEIAAGLNPNDGSDANGDIDNDGISNLKEYTTGTSSSSSDSDNDGIADNTELELGYDPAVYTKVVYVDASKADDTGDGLSLATAKQTIKAAVDMSRDTGFENVIMVAAGTYTGVNNKNIDFSGYDIKLRSISGAATTIIDLENSGRFLYLHTGETKASWLDGFTVKNGNVSDGGGVRFENAAMTLKNSVFMNNYASNYSYGGAIRSDNGSLLIVNCQFTNNHSYHHGGAIYQKYGKTSLENCSFIGNIGRRGGALALYEGVTLTADSCVFLRNLCNEEGGVVSSDNNCTSTFTNCLAMDNRARGNYTFALCYDNETMNLVNSTVVQGPSNMAGMRITGTLNVTNSVFRVTFAGTPASVVNSITTSDCSAYGANNVVADPQLNSMGYPWLNSPCIDAGTATGAPAKDMDGVSRPAGAGVDIGCYEFLDSDSDGMNDAWEKIYFGNLNQNATDDFDNDLLSNINEYKHDTKPTEVDTDSDGINDNIEVSTGYNPLVHTKIVYVDASRVDDTGDGLALENAKKTISVAISISKDEDKENVIMVAPGIYSGDNNKNIDLEGFDIKLRSFNGATETVIDLENMGYFLYLHNTAKVSWIDGFTIKNGNDNTVRGSVRLINSALILKNSVLGNNISGAVYSENSSLETIGCKFIANSTANGAAIALNGLTCKVTNCLFKDNKATSSGGTFYVYENSSLQVINCTMMNNNNGAIAGIYNDGSMEFINCAIYDTITGNGTKVINNCCAPYDLSQFGNNNIHSDPQLNSEGYPLTVSPCIDAGIAAGAPTKDIVGVSRPLGGGIDIGCYEFFDSDGDGLDNETEIELGLDPNNPADAAEDIDGDSLSNIDEYKRGTNIRNSDTDGDGLTDNIEVDFDLNPLDASDADGDSDQDGLTNHWELIHFGNQSQTASGDHDSDGFTNLEEMRLGLGFNANQELNDNIELNIYEYK